MCTSPVDSKSNQRPVCRYIPAEMLVGATIVVKALGGEIGEGQCAVFYHPPRLASIVLGVETVFVNLTGKISRFDWIDCSPSVDDSWSSGFLGKLNFCGLCPAISHRLH